MNVGLNGDNLKTCGRPNTSWPVLCHQDERCEDIWGNDQWTWLRGGLKSVVTLCLKHAYKWIEHCHSNLIKPHSHSPGEADELSFWGVYPLPTLTLIAVYLVIKTECHSEIVKIWNQVFSSFNAGTSDTIASATPCKLFAGLWQQLGVKCGVFDFRGTSLSFSLYFSLTHKAKHIRGDSISLV